MRRRHGHTIQNTDLSYVNGNVNSNDLADVYGHSDEHPGTAYGYFSTNGSSKCHADPYVTPCERLHVLHITNRQRQCGRPYAGSTLEDLQPRLGYDGARVYALLAGRSLHEQQLRHDSAEPEQRRAGSAHYDQGP